MNHKENAIVASINREAAHTLVDAHMIPIPDNGESEPLDRFNNVIHFSREAANRDYEIIQSHLNSLNSMRHHKPSHNLQIRSEVLSLWTASTIVECLRQLKDIRYYTRMCELIYLNNIPKINLLVYQLAAQHFITKKQLHYLLADDSARQRYFYIR